jgi:hypothetical protein
VRNIFSYSVPARVASRCCYDVAGSRGRGRVSTIINLALFVSVSPLTRVGLEGRCDRGRELLQMKILLPEIASLTIPGPFLRPQLPLPLGLRPRRTGVGIGGHGAGPWCIRRGQAVDFLHVFLLAPSLLLGCRPSVAGPGLPKPPALFFLPGVTRRAWAESKQMFFC